MMQGGYQVIIILLIKSKIAAAKKEAVLLCDFCIELSLHIRHSKSEVYNNHKFGISVNTYQ